MRRECTRLMLAVERLASRAQHASQNLFLDESIFRRENHPLPGGVGKGGLVAAIRLGALRERFDRAIMFLPSRIGRVGNQVSVEGDLPVASTFPALRTM